jgi:hypothetical protein
MAGNVKRLIDELMLLRTHKRPGSQHFVRAHLVLNGIDPDEYHDHTPDNPEAVVSLKKMIADFKKTL